MGKTKRQGFSQEPVIPPDFIAPLTALQHLLQQFDNRGVIVGGIAASLLGRPRLTADIDAVILLSTDGLEKLIEAAKEEGINVRIKDGETFARKNRVLLLKHESSEINIDISLGILPFEEELVEQGNTIHVMGIDIRIPRAEDLIIMKAIAHRPKDMEDIRSIVEGQPQLDRQHMKFWIEQFGELLDMRGLWEEIDGLL